MNKYGLGSMMDDYCFLEDVGRKVGEWGKEIIKGGFDMGVSGGRGGATHGRGAKGRGRGAMQGRGARGRGGKGKREVLKMFLEARDIELELLPNGMERRLMNQSVWDNKNQTALLTIQFKFHPSAEARSTSSSDTLKPFTLLTHRNNISTTLLSLIQKHVQERMNKKSNNKLSASSNTISTASSFPSWISSLVIPPPEDPENFTTPTFVIAAPADPSILVRSAALLASTAPILGQTRFRNKEASTRSKVYHALEPTEPLSKSLRGTQFVEFPLIEVWEEFSGVIVDKKTGGIRHTGGQEEPKRKRRKLNPEEGIKAMTGLLGDYGSDEEEGEGQVEEDASANVVGYVESDVEEEGQDNIVDEEIALDEEEWSDADAEGEIDFDADPAIILKLMEQAKREGKWIEEEEEEGDDSDDPGDQVQGTLSSI